MNKFLKIVFLTLVFLLLTAGYRSAKDGYYPLYFQDDRTELCFAYISTSFSIGLTQIPCTTKVRKAIEEDK